MSAREPQLPDGPTPTEASAKHQRPSASAQPQSTWSFVKWSAITLACVVALGVAVARLLHGLGIE